MWLVIVSAALTCLAGDWTLDWHENVVLVAGPMRWSQQAAPHCCWLSSIWINTPTPLGTRTQWWNFNLAAGCISNSTGHKIIFQIGNQQWVELRYQKNMNMFHQINVVTEWMWTNSMIYLDWCRPLHYYNAMCFQCRFYSLTIPVYQTAPTGRTWLELHQARGASNVSQGSHRRFS